MSPSDVRRVRFFEGQLLGQQDFQDLSRYFLDLARRHATVEHSWGIAVGLQLVESVPGATDGTSGGDRELYLEPGVFFDGFGRMCVLFDRVNLNSVAGGQNLAAGEYQLWVLYEHVKSNRPSPALASEVPELEEVSEWDRLSERVKVQFTSKSSEWRDPDNPVKGSPHESYGGVEPPPDDPSAEWPVFIGTAHWEGESFTEHSSTNRRYIGVRAETINAPSGKAQIRLGELSNQKGPSQESGSKSSPAGQFVVSTGPEENLVDRIRVDDEGKIWLNTPQLVIGTMDSSEFRPCLTVEDDCTVTVHGNLVVTGRISFSTVEAPRALWNRLLRWFVGLSKSR